MFPKLASGTSGKLRKNKGDGMIEMSDNEKRTRFFRLGESSTYTAEARETVLWAQNRIEYLEKHSRDMGQLFKQQEEEVANLQSHLNDRNQTIDRLEAEVKFSQTAVSQITGSTSQESDEDLHQRHRRERMLDEVTLICVRNGMNQGTESLAGQRYAGQLFRVAAENICDGINHYDA